MYYVYIAGELAFDALDDSSVVTSASVSQALNAAAYLDMGLAPSARVSEGDPVRVLWGGETLFSGTVTEASRGIDGTWDVTAVSDVARLADVLVPPHSTGGDVGERCPSSPSAYVQWLCETFNARSLGGFRVNVGTNQADRLYQGALDVSDDSWPTVAEDLQARALDAGGVLDWEPHEGSGTLSVWADLHEASDQVVDLGENMADVRVTRSLEGRRTAIVAHCGELDLTGLTAEELRLATNAGLMVSGGAIYDPEGVAEWGYSEERVELEGCSDRADLVRAAAARLRTMEGPLVTVECRAVDMALYREGYEHLRAGQAVRVRATPLGVDEYLAVQEMSLDLMDPGQTTYTLGVSYDTLTGNQSAFLRGLNGSINEAIDRVSDAEDTINRVVNDANTDYYLSDSPDEPLGGEWGVANIGQVDNKYLWARPHNTLVDGTEVLGDPTLVTPAIRRSLKLHRDVGDDPVWVSFVAANSDVTDPEAQGLCRITGQMGGWDAAEQGAVTVCFGFQDSAYAGGELAGVGIVTEKSSDIDLTRLDIQAYVDNGRVGVYVMLTGEVTVSLYAEGEGFSTPFVELPSEPSGERVFSLADAKTTYESAILQADNALRAYVEATYATKAGVGESIAQLDLRADQIQASVEQKMDASVAETTFVNKSTFDQTVGSITTTVEETKTVAEGAASDAQTAVTTATEAKQTADGISSTVSEAVETANGAYEKATTVEQTVDGLEVKIDGSVNLIRNSDFTDGTNYWVAENATMSIGQSSVFDAILVADMSTSSGRVYPSVTTNFTHVSGHKYLLSFFAFAPNANRDIRASIAGGTAIGTWSLTKNSWKRCTAQYTAGGTGSLTFRLTSTDKFYLAEVMLQDVTVASNWSPSPLDPASTATNYLRFDSSGLCVGNMTASSLGMNTLVAAAKVALRNGTTELATFSPSLVELGKNSTSSQIKMCGGQGKFQYVSSSGFSISSTSNMNIQANNKEMTIQASSVSLRGITTTVGNTSSELCTTYVRGRKIYIGNNGVPIRGIYVGSKTLSASNNKHPTLFTDAQYKAIVGRSWNGTYDYVGVMNSNYAANTCHVGGAIYNPNTRNLYASCQEDCTNPIQINYVIVAYGV